MTLLLILGSNNASAQQVLVDLYTDWTRAEVAGARVELIDRSDYRNHWIRYTGFPGEAERGIRLTSFDNVIDNRNSYMLVVTLLDSRQRPVDGTQVLFLPSITGGGRIIPVRMVR